MHIDLIMQKWAELLYPVGQGGGWAQAIIDGLCMTPHTWKAVGHQAGPPCGPQLLQLYNIVQPP